MGVPAFFRWLMLRYPKIVIEAREELELGFDINQVIKNNTGVDERMPTIDNLYFDMNGIIHPCAHPEDRDPPSSIAEMFNSIFDYCDKLIRIIKPKKLIYMAIDGVAPRAKMNQQRSRRFRAAIDAQQKERISRKIEQEWRSKGLPTDFLEQNNKKFKFDSNCITPGTEFLDQCSTAVKTYIKSRLNNDPLWKDLNVIFSDASVPGEGEHKILDFIRTQRTYSNYNPNTYHCIYGADADLIMLSLIMHEPHFYVIRESLSDKYYLVCEHCGRHGHSSVECDVETGKFNRSKATKAEIAQHNKEQIDEIEFSLLKVGILREYLELEFKNLIDLGYNFERIIDDFVFLCFLVGNDFLPNLPSLKIREGAIDALIYLYKNLLPKMNNYLTNGKGQLNLNECETLFKILSLVEDKFFKKEMEIKMNDEKFRKNNPVLFGKPKLLDTFRSIAIAGNNNYNNKNNRNTINLKKNDKYNEDEIDLVDIVGNITSIEKDEALKKNFNLGELKKHGLSKYQQIVKEEIYEENNKKVDEYVDTIKLGEKDWKDRYYKQKFHVSPNINDKAFEDLKQKIKKYYIEGLCWVFEYYYNGCISWSWFYPFHYAPFASDLTNLNDIKINFDLNSPFYAFEQLLSVLPPYSADALPKCFQKLMRDPLSPIADFYPSNVKLDINNQPYAWMGVNLLPFIDAERVKKIVKNVIDNGALNEKEKKLNQRGENILISKDLEITHYFQGELSIHPEMNTYDKFLKEDSVIKGIHPGDVKKDKSQSFIFKKKVNNIMHCSKVLDGVIPEPKCIIEDNLDNYPKTKFKGKQAIEMVKEVLGTTNDNLEGYFLQETFDDKYGNNNRAVEYDPQKMFLLMKKRYQENQNAITKKKKNNDEINRNNNIDSNSRNTNNNNNKNNIVNNNSNDLNMNNNNKNKSRNNNINNSYDSNGNNINNNNLPIINLDEDKEEGKDVENKKTKKKTEQKKETKKPNKLLEVMNFLNNKNKNK
jgi:5'-3' exoribonuclease 2